MTDPVLLTVAASALRHAPPKHRAAHLSPALLDLARRLEAIERDRREREEAGLVDWDDAA
jgi:hypothetical protein